MKGRFVSDWALFEKMGGIDNPKCAHALRGSLNHFLAEPTTAPFKAAAQAFARTGDVSIAKSTLIQAFGTSADFPSSASFTRTRPTFLKVAASAFRSSPSFSLYSIIPPIVVFAPAAIAAIGQLYKAGFCPMYRLPAPGSAIRLSDQRRPGQ